jgi:hypothetical protein
MALTVSIWLLTPDDVVFGDAVLGVTPVLRGYGKPNQRRKAGVTSWKDDCLRQMARA